jgi:hypothetical protein
MELDRTAARSDERSRVAAGRVLGEVRRLQRHGPVVRTPGLSDALR